MLWESTGGEPLGRPSQMLKYFAFPFFLSIGMTYDQYWNDDCLLVKYYCKVMGTAKEPVDARGYI